MDKLRGANGLFLASQSLPREVSDRSLKGTWKPRRQETRATGEQKAT